MNTSVMIKQSFELYGVMNARKQNAIRCEALWVFYFDRDQFCDNVRGQQPAQVEPAVCDGALFGMPVGS